MIPDYLICLECEAPVYLFEWEEGKLTEAQCATCGNEDLTPEEWHFSVDNAAARIAVYRPSGEMKKHIHVVLMAKTGSTWDVWYLSNQLYKEVFLPTAAKN